MDVGFMRLWLWSLDHSRVVALRIEGFVVLRESQVRLWKGFRTYGSTP